MEKEENILEEMKDTSTGTVVIGNNKEKLDLVFESSAGSVISDQNDMKKGEYHTTKNNNLYLHNLELDDEQRYQLKLIQYRDIEYIKLQSHLDYNEYDGGNNNKKIFLKQHCLQLKQVKILDIFQYQPIGGYKKELFDYTQNGLYKFKWLMWDYNLGQDNLQLFKPKKLFLFSNMLLTKSQEDDILKCNFIKTFKFFSVNTSDEFIGKVLSNRALPNNNIKSLSIRVSPKYFITPNYSLAGIESSTSSSPPYEKVDLSNNTVLKKLIILIKVNDNIFHQHYLASTTSTCPKSLFHCLETNHSIEKLGLIGYNIKDSKILEPLKKFKNINTLYCDTSDIKVLHAHLSHCNHNSNIKKLHISDYYNLDNQFNKQHILLILKFIKDNKNSLNLIIWKFNYRNYINLINYNLDTDLETKLFFQLFNNDENYYHLKNNKNNNLICKLKF